jgi:putative transposase
MAIHLSCPPDPDMMPVTSRIVVDALEMAVQRRLPEEGLLAHSDRGSQYAKRPLPEAVGQVRDRVQYERSRSMLG